MKRFRRCIAFLTCVMMVSCAPQQYGVVRTEGRRIENDELMRATAPARDERYAKTQHRQTASDNAKRFGLSVELEKSEFPNYPKHLQAAGVEGVVEVAFLVDRSGQVRDPQIVASPHPELSAICLDVIRKWRFKPITQDGVVVAPVLRQQFPFRLH